MEEKLLDFQITIDPEPHLTILDSFPILLLCKSCPFMMFRTSLLISLFLLLIIWWLMSRHIGNLLSMDILGVKRPLNQLLFCPSAVFSAPIYFWNNIRCFINTVSVLYTASGQLYALTCLAFLVGWIHGVHRTAASDVM